MIPQTLLNVIQTGAKYFLDLDPTITEHLARHLSMQLVSWSQHGASVLLQFGNRFASGFTPFADGLRSLKLHLSQT
jgi:hypothetical protein